MPTSNVVASAARTTTGQSAGVDVPYGRDDIDFRINVTAVSGTTPSLTLSVEWSDNGTDWAKAEPADAFAAITTASHMVKRIAAKADKCRLVWTITGTTPSFTFSVDNHWKG